MRSQSRPRAVKDHCELKKAAVKLVLLLASRLPDRWGGGPQAEPVLTSITCVISLCCCLSTIIKRTCHVGLHIWADFCLRAVIRDASGGLVDRRA